ncbi:Spo0B domain-containing protein [Terrilactibacillus sp. S3-3]|nr:Spo0B domain-containing protein [Terrilactibacillus sp. S3-3]
MLDEEKLLEIFRYARHDWLNELQLIKGYLSLEKFDQVEKIIERLIEKLQNEAGLSNLKVPKLAAYLLTFNWSMHRFHLTFKVPRGDSGLSSWDEALVLFFKAFFFHVIDEQASKMTDNQLELAFDIGTAARIFLIFEGRMADENGEAAYTVDRHESIFPFG